jgi:hypothetical protein
VPSTRQWLIVINVQSDSGMEVAISADSKWLMPTFFTHTPIAVLDYVTGGLVDARRGDDIFVELKSPSAPPATFVAPTSDAVVGWLATRLVEAWHETRARSGTYRPAAAPEDSSDEAKRGAG